MVYGEIVLYLWTRISAFLLPLLVLLCAAPAHAQNGNGAIKVDLATGIILSKSADLDFGEIIPGTTGGTVTINAQTGAVTRAGGVISVGGTTSRAQFTAIGSQGRIVTMSMAPSPSITLNRFGGGASMTVNQVRASINGGNSGPLAPNVRLPTNGTIVISIGGRLNVGANQMEGRYTADLTFTVNYQ